MPELLTLPEVQSALVPLLVSLVFGALAARIAPLSPAVGVGFAFVATALLVNGFEFATLTAARKVILVIVAALAVGLVADAARKTLPLAVTLGLGIISGAWVFGIVLMRAEATEMILTAAGIAAAIAWLVFWVDRLRGDGLRAGGAALALGLGAGLAAIVGSSALLGQLALALGAGAGGYLLLLLMLRRNDCGFALSFPLAVGSALLVCAAAVFAELTWFAVALVALVPLAAGFVPVRATWPRIVQAAVISIAALAVSAAAIGAARFVSSQNSSGY